MQTTESAISDKDRAYRRRLRPTIPTGRCPEALTETGPDGGHDSLVASPDEQEGIGELRHELGQVVNQPAEVRSVAAVSHSPSPQGTATAAPGGLERSPRIPTNSCMAFICSSRLPR